MSEGVSKTKTQPVSIKSTAILVLQTFLGVCFKKISISNALNKYQYFHYQKKWRIYYFSSGFTLLRQSHKVAQ